MDNINQPDEVIVADHQAICPTTDSTLFSAEISTNHSNETLLLQDLHNPLAETNIGETHPIQGKTESVVKNEIEASCITTDEKDNIIKIQSKSERENVSSPDSSEKNLVDTCTTESTELSEEKQNVTDTLEDLHSGTSNTMISTPAGTSESVSSLFKNVVLVQASSIINEEADSNGSSASHESSQSDPEGDYAVPVIASSVEDIGREEEPIENRTLHLQEFLIDERIEVNNYETMEGIEVGKMEKIIAMDALVIDPDEVQDNNDNDEISTRKSCTSASEDDLEGNIVAATKSPNGEKDLQDSMKSDGDQAHMHNVSEASTSTQLTTQKKFENSEKTNEIDTISLSTDEDVCDTGKKEATLRMNKKRKLASVRIINVEKELLNVKKNKSNDGSTSKNPKNPHRYQDSAEDPFGSWSSSSSENIPNDIYFGAPDRVYTVGTKLRWHRQKQNGTKHSRVRDGQSQSSAESDDEEHVQKRAKKVAEIAKLQLPAYQQQQLQTMLLKKQRKRDRFYDRSQDIPNDIYFGNVKVPLHILHATSSSSSDEEAWTGNNVKSTTRTNIQHYNSTHGRSKPRTSGSYRNSSSSKSQEYSHQTSNRSIQSMKEYLKIAGFRKVRYQKLWQNCHSTQDRADAILRFLQANGLQGEPTIDKCRELRKQIQLEQEVEVLDRSVIIDGGEGRVTRQRTRKAPESTSVHHSDNFPEAIGLELKTTERQEPADIHHSTVGETDKLLDSVDQESIEDDLKGQSAITHPSPERDVNLSSTLNE
ncbi:HIRA-interacting protein 3-like [Anopheles nili]|uniref:HIRA-interacting protein 3-like n=1 Tax=Anopheles nili TaxID=185578 RepID=UPI00237B5906|nr:HIRA-interacting protein 3-like [Anopheles nili]